MDTFQTLHSDILQLRDCGEVTVCVTERPTITTHIHAVLDDFVARFNFLGMGEGWREIDVAAAKQIISEIIFRDLAYGVKMTTEERAGELAEKFFSIFAEQPRYFTNAVFKNGQLSSWYPISASTFDTGVICLDTRRIGILWVQDED